MLVRSMYLDLGLWRGRLPSSKPRERRLGSVGRLCTPVTQEVRVSSAASRAFLTARRGDVSSDVPGRLCSPDTNRHLNRPRRVSGPPATPIFTVSPRLLTENLSTKYIWYRFVLNIDSSIEYRTLLSMVGGNRTNRAWELRYFMSLIDFVLQN